MSYYKPDKVYHSFGLNYSGLDPQTSVQLSHPSPEPLLHTPYEWPAGTTSAGKTLTPQTLPRPSARIPPTRPPREGLVAEYIISVNCWNEDKCLAVHRGGVYIVLLACRSIQRCCCLGLQSGILVSSRFWCQVCSHDLLTISQTTYVQSLHSSIADFLSSSERCRAILQFQTQWRLPGHI